MPCPCLLPILPASYLGGWLGTYFFGVNPPTHPGGQELSIVLTAELVAITVIALKALFNISLCMGGGFTLNNVAHAGVKVFIMGMIYSIGINYLLKRYVFPSSEARQDEEGIDDKPPQNSDLHTSHCCDCK